MRIGTDHTAPGVPASAGSPVDIVLETRVKNAAYKVGHLRPGAKDVSRSLPVIPRVRGRIDEDTWPDDSSDAAGEPRYELKRALASGEAAPNALPLAGLPPLPDPPKLPQSGEALPTLFADESASAESEPAWAGASTAGRAVKDKKDDAESVAGTLDASGASFPMALGATHVSVGGECPSPAQDAGAGARALFTAPGLRPVSDASAPPGLASAAQAQPISAPAVLPGAPAIPLAAQAVTPDFPRSPEQRVTPELQGSSALRSLPARPELEGTVDLPTGSGMAATSGLPAGSGVGAASGLPAGSDVAEGSGLAAAFDGAGASHSPRPPPNPLHPAKRSLLLKPRR